MKLRVTFELPLPEGYEPFLRVIAEMHGYSEANCPGVSVSDFICKNICEPQVSALFHSLINNALSPYFGIAGRQQVEAIEGQYATTHAVVANMIDD